MPKEVPKLEQPLTVVTRQWLVVAIEVGNVVNLCRDAAYLDVIPRHEVRRLKLAERARECDLLLIRDVLIWKDQDRESVHTGLNLGDLFWPQWLPQIDPGNAASKVGTRRIGGLDAEFHGPYL
jgi:hypothetical protein